MIDESALRAQFDLIPPVDAWADYLNIIRQNRLLSEAEFLRFAKDREVPVWGILSGTPGEFHRQGWLSADGNDYDGKPTFHPFRIYVLHLILRMLDLNVAPTAFLQREAALRLVKHCISHLPKDPQIRAAATFANKVVDLAVALEPVYWPRLTSSRKMGIDPEHHMTLLRNYRANVEALVQSLDRSVWKEVHLGMRLEAERTDCNGNLYLLLRVATWEQRERLRGSIGCALWIRHVAEVIRRAFEDNSDQRWEEEDTATGQWFGGARLMNYGAERPLDDTLRAKPYVAHEFGLFTGSAVRWYVEGDTEFYAIKELIGDTARCAVELANLRGRIESGKDNAALKWRDWFLEDVALRRFSMVSLDGDLTETKKVLRTHINASCVVGTITLHEPDFEFSNFTIKELVEVASKIDEDDGYSGGAVRSADWSTVGNGRTFERIYCRVSASMRGRLKGEIWGRALAKYASTKQDHPESGDLRPILRDVRTALWGWRYDYDYFRQNFQIEPNTFAQEKRSLARPGNSS